MINYTLITGAAGGLACAPRPAHCASRKTPPKTIGALLSTLAWCAQPGGCAANNSVMVSWNYGSNRSVNSSRPARMPLSTRPYSLL